MSPQKRQHWFLTDGSLGLLQGPLVHDVSEHGQQEGDGLAAAGLGDADEVSARHDGGDGLGLDRGGLIVAVPGEGTKDVKLAGRKKDV